MNTKKYAYSKFLYLLNSVASQLAPALPFCLGMVWAAANVALAPTGSWAEDDKQPTPAAEKNASASDSLPPTRPVRAVLPAPWTPPTGAVGTIDFAEVTQADAWLRHVALGDPSFDNFRHAESNPVVRGKPPFEWPVNGVLFADPQSGNWYLYVGHYHDKYQLGPKFEPTHCRAYRSVDKGRTWLEIGPIFPGSSFHFQGDKEPSNVAPDVSVVYDGGRYHLAYDWVSDNLGWEQVWNPPGGLDSGIAYAWAEKPEGPFHRLAQPTVRNSKIRNCNPLSEKYSRFYASSLIRRENDWLVLCSADASVFFRSVQVMTAKEPTGPWSDPVAVLSVEGDRYYPHTVETYPAFVHDGYVYAPKTSVAANRDYQVIYRAKIEEAHRPEAWELFQDGSVWHSEFVSHEAAGIWGQTFNGFVDSEGVFQVMFPSKDSTNLGTINLASRPWNKPLRDRGFTFGAYGGRSLTLLRSAYRGFTLETDFSLRGAGARIVWGYHAPIGPNSHVCGATLHPLCLTRHYALAIQARAWQVLSVNAAGKATILARGTLEAGVARKIALSVGDNGDVQLTLEGKPAWQGKLPVIAGPIGVLLEPHTSLAVDRFSVTGRVEPAVFSWLCTEGMSAGVYHNDWTVARSTDYRFGIAAVRTAPGGRVKWNFRGRGFRLWLPKGPEYGRCEILLDGRKLAEVDLRADRPEPSSAVYDCEDAGDGYHAVVVKSIAGHFAADSLDVLN
jgi:hypothetical protein